MGSLAFCPHCFLSAERSRTGELLLRSQLYLWVSLFSVIFLCMLPFLNKATEVVTFRLPGWYMLDVFLLPAITRLGHECQDLLSPCDGMHVCIDST